MIVHEPGCGLDPVHWLRHAIAASGYLVREDREEQGDVKSAMSLIDTLAHFAELDSWAGVTLHDIASHATLMNDDEVRDRFRYLCTCGAF